MGGGGKGSKPQEQSQVQNMQISPWGPAQEPLQNLFGQAGGMASQQPFPYPGVVPFSPSSVAGMEAMQNRAMMGSPVQASGQAENLRTTSGHYLDSQPGSQYLDPYTRQSFGGLSPLSGYTGQANINQYAGAPQLQQTSQGDYLYGGEGFNAAYDAAARKVLPQVTGQAAGVGRYGGGLQQTELTGALGDVFAGMYGQERGRQEAASQALAQLTAGERARATGAAGQYGGLYGQERGRATQAASQMSSQAQMERDRMLKASAAAPGMAQADYADIERLLGVGGMQEGKAGQALADAQARWGFQQQSPFNLQSHQAGVYGAAAPYTSQYGTTEGEVAPQESGTNPMGAALGGAGAGFAMGGPWGAAAGAGLGLMSAMK